MTVPSFSQDELIEYIKSFGWTILEPVYWNDYSRLCFVKDDEMVTLQCMKSRYYFFNVYRTCKLFNIKCPPEHCQAYYRHMRMDDHPCWCDEGEKTGKLFKDCHGKAD